MFAIEFDGMPFSVIADGDHSHSGAAPTALAVVKMQGSPFAKQQPVANLSKQKKQVAAAGRKLLRQKALKSIGFFSLSCFISHPSFCKESL